MALIIKNYQKNLPKDKCCGLYFDLQNTEILTI